MKKKLKRNGTIHIIFSFSIVAQAEEKKMGKKKNCLVVHAEAVIKIVNVFFIAAIWTVNQKRHFGAIEMETKLFGERKTYRALVDSFIPANGLCIYTAIEHTESIGKKMQIGQKDKVATCCI